MVAEPAAPQRPALGGGKLLLDGLAGGIARFAAFSGAPPIEHEVSMTKTISFGIGSSVTSGAGGVTINAKVPPSPPVASSDARRVGPATFHRKIRSRFGIRSAASSVTSTRDPDSARAFSRCDTDDIASIGPPACTQSRSLHERSRPSPADLARLGAMSRVYAPARAGTP